MKYALNICLTPDAIAAVNEQKTINRLKNASQTIEFIIKDYDRVKIKLEEAHKRLSEISGTPEYNSKQRLIEYEKKKRLVNPQVIA